MITGGQKEERPKPDNSAPLKVTTRTTTNIIESGVEGKSGQSTGVIVEHVGVPRPLLEAGLGPTGRRQAGAGCSADSPDWGPEVDLGRRHSSATELAVPASRRDIDESEGKILLRQTDSGKLAALWSARRKSTLLSEKEEDTRSVTTTTSDVKSSDDATSIASRLNQIVVEQEGRLMVEPSNSENEMDYVVVENADVVARCTVEPSSITAPTRSGNQVRRKTPPPLWSIRAYEPPEESARAEPKVGIKLVKSSINLVSQGSSDKETVWPKADTNSLDASSSQELKTPKIQVVECEADFEAPSSSEQLTLRRVRARSVAISDASRRQDSPSNNQPERGDLKRLEMARNMLQQQIQSSRFGQSSGEPDPASSPSIVVDNHGQPILNIQRSTWTLDDFDQTFNKCGDKTDSSSSPDNRRKSVFDFSDNQNGPRTPPPASTLIPNRSFKNLLLKGSQSPPSVRCFSVGPIYHGHQQPTVGQLVTGKHGRLTNDIQFGVRRSSSSQSIISFPSPGLRFGGTESRRSSQVFGNRKHSKLDPNGLMQDDPHQDTSCLASCCSYTTISRFVPCLKWFPEYDYRNCFLSDLMSGITVAFINITVCISAAMVAQTEMGAAFRSSMIGCLVYSLLTCSNHVAFGAWSIMSQMLLVSVQRALSDELILDRLNAGSGFEPEEYKMWHYNIVIMYTFLIGLVQLLSGVLNLGSILSSFIPEALCSALIVATSIVMAVGQLANMCGTTNKILWSIERNTTELYADLKDPPVDITDLFAGLFRWLEQIALLVKHYDQINFYCVLISISSVTLLFLNQEVFQKYLWRLFKKKVVIPFEILVIGLFTIVSYTMQLHQNYEVPVTGPMMVDLNLPSLPNLRLVRELWVNSIATAIISYTITMIMARTYANKFNYEVDTNQELIACGAANLIGGLCNALPGTGAFARTASQVESGGKTQMASIVNCVTLLIIIKSMGHFMGDLPKAVMAAIMFYSFIRMVRRFPEVFMYWRICKLDFIIWIVTFCAIIIYDLVNGFLYGVMFSLITMLYRAQNRRCYMLGSIGSSDVYVPLREYPAAEELEGIKIFQFCGPVHYVCAELFERLLRHKTRVNIKQIVRDLKDQDKSSFNPRELNLPSHIIIDFSMISFIDTAGLQTIKKIIEDHQKINITVMCASLVSHVAEMVKNDESFWETYKDRFYVTLADAVHRALQSSSSSMMGKKLQYINFSN